MKTPVLVLCSDNRIDEGVQAQVLESLGLERLSPFALRILGGALIFNLDKLDPMQVCDALTFWHQLQRLVGYGADGIVLTVHGGECLEAINHFGLYQKGVHPSEEASILREWLTGSLARCKQHLPGVPVIPFFIPGEWLGGH